jgi:hypothetical protein
VETQFSRGVSFTGEIPERNMGIDGGKKAFTKSHEINIRGFSAIANTWNVLAGLNC